jgi:hypothetical protein
MKSRRSEQATAAALVVLGTFQAALAAGAPWGRAAYGGNHPGPLPVPLRMTSSVAALGYGTGAVFVLRGGGSPRRRASGFTALALFMGIATVANGASRSPIERTLWTPVTAVTAVSAWRSRTTRGDLRHQTPRD